MRRTLFRTAAAAALSVVATVAMAQYKWQSPDGGIVYSDLPPPPGVKLMADGRGHPVTESGEPALPFALKHASDRYPVTLYSVADCEPCDAGRRLLSERGIPFNERSLSSTSDIDAYKALGFPESSLPGVTVGSDRSTGFEATTWHRLLDAAGYPKSSMLPASYKRAAAQPLTPPPAQKVRVAVSDTPEGEAGEIRSAESSAAIDRYRQLMREAEAARDPSPRPDIRF